MKYLMFYEMAPDGLPKAMANLPAHQGRLNPFLLNGVVGKHTIQEWSEALAP